MNGFGTTVCDECRQVLNDLNGRFRFVDDLQAEMREALQTLDVGMPNNPLVRVGQKRNKDGWITVTPFDPQPDPANLARELGVMKTKGRSRRS
jgi:hypothetical protein